MTRQLTSKLVVCSHNSRPNIKEAEREMSSSDHHSVHCWGIGTCSYLVANKKIPSVRYAICQVSTMRPELSWIPADNPHYVSACWCCHSPYVICWHRYHFRPVALCTIQYVPQAGAINYIPFAFVGFIFQNVLRKYVTYWSLPLIYWLHQDGNFLGGQNITVCDTFLVH